MGRVPAGDPGDARDDETVFRPVMDLTAGRACRDLELDPGPSARLSADLRGAGE